MVIKPSIKTITDPTTLNPGICKIELKIFVCQKYMDFMVSVEIHRNTRVFHMIYEST